MIKILGTGNYTDLILVDSFFIVFQFLRVYISVNPSGFILRLLRLVGVVACPRSESLLCFLQSNVLTEPFWIVLAFT